MLLHYVPYCWVSSISRGIVFKSPSPLVCSHVTQRIYPVSKQPEGLSKYLKLWKSFDSVVSTNDTLYYHFNLDSDLLWQFYHYNFIHVNGCVMTVTTSANHSSVFHTIFPLADNEISYYKWLFLPSRHIT